MESLIEAKEFLADLVTRHRHVPAALSRKIHALPQKAEPQPQIHHQIFLSGILPQFLFLSHILLSAGAAPRIHFTALSRENPAAPPMFCMLLRKHLSGGYIEAVEQAGLDPAHIAVSDICTACRSDLFWSHRKLGTNRGSMAAAVQLV